MLLEPTFSIRVTHTGVFPDGRANTESILINDLDSGDGEQRFQSHKVPVYVPAGGFIEIPLSSRAMFSLTQGAIFVLEDAGLVTVEVIAPAGTQTSAPASAAAPWADGTGAGNDVSVSEALFVAPTVSDDGFLARRLVSGTNGHHILLVWQVPNPWVSSDIVSTDPFITLHYQLDQAVATAIDLTVRSGITDTETEVPATPGGSTVGSHALLLINWDDLPEGFLTGSDQVLEIRVDVTLDTVTHVAYVGPIDFNWSP